MVQIAVIEIQNDDQFRMIQMMDNRSAAKLIKCARNLQKLVERSPFPSSFDVYEDLLSEKEKKIFSELVETEYALVESFNKGKKNYNHAVEKMKEFIHIVDEYVTNLPKSSNDEIVEMNRRTMLFRIYIVLNAFFDVEGTIH